MESILEQQRRLHEEMERLEHIGAKILLRRPRTHKEKLATEHRLKDVLNRIQSIARKLFAFYEDKDNLRHEEIDALSPPNEFEEFYRRLKMIEHHDQKFPEEYAEYLDIELSGLDDIEEEQLKLESLFTGEEGYGEFLDLHRHYEKYLNLRLLPKRVDYLHYINEFDRFSNIPNEGKDAVYKAYLEDLAAYLLSFLHRTQPLRNMHDFHDQIRCEFEGQWKQSLQATVREDKDVLYCSVCDKTFSKNTVFRAHMTGKKHIKNAEKGTTATITNKPLDSEYLSGKTLLKKDISYLEHCIMRYGGLFSKEREETKVNIERKQSRTSEERMEDLQAIEERTVEEVKQEEGESDEEEKPIYNPLKLPLGWDGKPIPYWLYKLHGLGIEYKCEICGGYTYMGRKSFERHFEEWRHTYGLKCLGIVNSSHFHEITSIQDALALWGRLDHIKKEIDFKPDTEEEFEDQHGNVFNKKTYEDLVRQGLL
jgi:splicing factor 3A subunit 3